MSVVANRSINKGDEMTDEKILTKHPSGKTGRNIDREKYDTLKKAILWALRKK